MQQQMSWSYLLRDENTRWGIFKSAKQLQNNFSHVTELYIESLGPHFSLEDVVNTVIIGCVLTFLNQPDRFENYFFPLALPGSARISCVYTWIAVVWEKGMLQCAVFIPLTQGKTTEIKKKFSGITWRPKEGQIWGSAVWTEWSEKQKWRHLSASWDTNLTLNNHHAISHNNSFFPSASENDAAWRTHRQGMRTRHCSALGKVWLSWFCAQTTDHRFPQQSSKPVQHQMGIWAHRTRKAMGSWESEEARGC